MADQRRRARAATRDGGVAMGDEVDAFHEILASAGQTDFVGRDEDTATTTVVGVVPGDGDTVSVFLATTPFYAEAGGQVGDTGTIVGPHGRADVLDTVYALPGLHRHVARLTEGVLDLGDEVTAAIDADRRNAIRRHHTGTPRPPLGTAPRARLPRPAAGVARRP